MSGSHGNFVWYDLMTTDTKSAETFYRGVVGWTAKDSGMPDRSYTILSVGDVSVGGLMPLPKPAQDQGAKPVWSGYIGVDDVDDYAARVKKAGGSLHCEPQDIPGVGRFAFAADPQGAAFFLFKGTLDAAPQPPAPGTPGYVGWRELQAGNWEDAFAFYSTLFGWTKAETVSMGAMGVYQLFAIDGVPAGGMMTRTDTAHSPHWLYYFNTDDIDTAAARIKDKGGEVLHGPHEVPGGAWIIHCRDPQGGAFSMSGPRK